MASSGDVRKAGKRGTWYTYDKQNLSDEIDAWLDKVPNTINGHELPIQGARVIIAPHAGYTYSGACAAWAYKTLDLRGIKRVFLLGPSHTYYLVGPAVTKYSSYDTPFGPLQVDSEVVAALRATGKTRDIPRSSDAAEHSLEMHLPYLYKRLQQAFGATSAAAAADYPTIVPVLIGDGKAAEEKDTARLLVPYLRDPANAFIVSSDFCHWGRGFSYMPYLASDDLDNITQVSTGGGSRRYADPPIHEGIRVLDEAAFAAIETGSHDAFVAYLRKTENTVCGRHPIGVVMAALEILAEENPAAAADADAGHDEKQKGKGKFTFIQYQRSELVERPGDTSVSYAAAYAMV